MFPLNLGIRAHDLDVRNREEIVQKVSQLHLQVHNPPMLLTVLYYSMLRSDCSGSTDR